MKYVTQADFDGEFGQREMAQLMRRDGASIDTSANWAENVVDGYLAAAGLSVPTVCPADLVGVICDLARWRFYDDAVTETVQARYDAAIAYLNKIASGQITPPWAITEGGYGIAASAPVAVFSRLVW